MEFEKNAPVTDEQRILAESKKITLQPTHTDVVPEDISDSEIASRHINGQPLGNTRNDIEQDAPTLHQADETVHPTDPDMRKQSAKLMLIIVGVASVLIVASLFFVFAIIG